MFYYPLTSPAADGNSSISSAVDAHPPLQDLLALWGEGILGDISLGATKHASMYSLACTGFSENPSRGCYNLKLRLILLTQHAPIISIAGLANFDVNLTQDRVN